ncbi:hypothetical protein LTR36_010759 [Oleoguttula mirabilis]|uniref:F-box domain-containing protein n=1 Tax=Oleoguttula mirabilis TaxID=1507867 RepID=A0AAV9JQX6_9PEZI|nr:hypothetical protein LTR36_010759 [Oleoguttula mirabilis]
MAAITETLPPELLSRIFSFLSSERHDISVSRLVCHAFKELSSPFLITRAVLAKRLPTITHLYEICQHPYYHRYVAELVWDASVIDKSEHDSLHEYVESCEFAPRRFKDSSWQGTQKRRLAEWQRLEELRQNGHGHASIEASAVTSLSHMSTDSSHEGEEDITNAGEGDMDRAERLGLFEAYRIYRARWKAQRQIEESGLMKSTLAYAFARLPKLRTLVFTDYRSLAADGECFNDCCRRLFGNVLQPLSLDRQLFNPEPFVQFLGAIGSVAPAGRIQSLIIPRHPFESMDTALDPSDTDPREPICVTASHATLSRVWTLHWIPATRTQESQYV